MKNTSGQMEMNEELRYANNKILQTSTFPLNVTEIHFSVKCDGKVAWAQN